MLTQYHAPTRRVDYRSEAASHNQPQSSTTTAFASSILKLLMDTLAIEQASNSQIGLSLCLAAVVEFEAVPNASCSRRHLNSSKDPNQSPAVRTEYTNTTITADTTAPPLPQISCSRAPAVTAEPNFVISSAQLTPSSSPTQIHHKLNNHSSRSAAAVVYPNRAQRVPAPST
ncbi:hypothetical protein M0R45_002457 [Rubus argutus]|uniref:Uncharacterized protein n=1 Tax=Rubus argutus TaxID=59490 RepID=A0AAW1VMX5_RUBAR